MNIHQAIYTSIKGKSTAKASVSQATAKDIEAVVTGVLLNNNT